MIGDSGKENTGRTRVHVLNAPQTEIKDAFSLESEKTLILQDT